MCGLFCLASFTSHVFKAHLHYSMRKYFIPFYCRTILLARVYHNLFIHQLMNLGCFHVLAIMTNAAMNNCFCVAVCFLFSWVDK